MDQEKEITKLQEKNESLKRQNRIYIEVSTTGPTVMAKIERSGIQRARESVAASLEEEEGTSSISDSACPGE